MAISETRKRFNEAFRSARNSGDKTFEFEGKKYTTELASESRPKATDTGDETARLARRTTAPVEKDKSVPEYSRSNLSASPVKSDTPRRGAGMLESIKDYYASPSSLEGVKRNIENTLNATAGLSAPGVVGKETAKQFATRSAARRAEEGMSSEEAADLMRRKALSEADTSGGATGYKKGGNVKSKSSVKGWGIARGARTAKYF